ncbi:MAG TPA: class I SAM-dependent methyltransferase [Planctomycetia bacterium]|nr:class I SAM-dependent methyltransferase [Planctomycetia bacterium]
MKALVRKIARRTPIVGGMLQNIDDLRAQIRTYQTMKAESSVPQIFPPGHYYSPVPDPKLVRADAARIFDRNRRHLPGIDMNDEGQLALLDAFAPLVAENDFPESKIDGQRYYYVNDWYPYGDAICLYSMLRHRRPGRICEIGSGYSSAVILDVNDRYLGGKMRCTFVEPNPERLLAAVRPDERDRIALIRRPVQEVPVEAFAELEAGDILLIDSTHVSKVGSDVNYLFLEVLPTLKPGVAVHVHDVWFPFEYPPEWIERGIYWNEDYLLRAFLQFNSGFKVIFCNTYMQRFFPAEYEASMRIQRRGNGGSIWFERR